jgi:hypothetical protein
MNDKQQIIQAMRDEGYYISVHPSKRGIVYGWECYIEEETGRPIQGKNYTGFAPTEFEAVSIAVSKWGK